LQDVEGERVSIVKFGFVGIACIRLDIEEDDEEEEKDEVEEDEDEEVGSMSCPMAKAFADPQQSQVPSALQHQRPPDDALQGWTTFDSGESNAVSY